MKKHPIDEEFAKKMANYRLEPSSRALEKFQERLSKNTKPVVLLNRQSNRRWLYLAASMVVIASGVVLMLDSPQNEKKMGVKLSHYEKKQIKGVSIEHETEIPIKAIASAEKGEKYLSFLPSVSVRPEEKEDIQEDNQVIEEFKPMPTLVFEETSGISPTSPKESTNQEVFKKDIGESIVVVLEPAIESPVLVEEIDQDSELAWSEATEMMRQKEENNQSFIGKLFKEYKNLKYGKEEVSLSSTKVSFSGTSAPIVSELGEVRDFMQRKIGRLQRR